MTTEPGSTCRHCRSPIPLGSSDAEYCCNGCREVARLISEADLGRYYSLTDSVSPAKTHKGDRSLVWLDPVLEGAAQQGPVCRVDLDVQGVHCAACVWLMDELFKRRPGSVGCTVNPALGKITLSWRQGALDLRDYVRDVERFGYTFGPSRKANAPGLDDLTIRIGICAAITMNTMMVSAAFYTGLAPTEGLLFDVFSQVAFWLTTIATVVGGWVFFRSAWEGLRRRMLHLDLPIALGILLVYGTSLAQAGIGRGDLAYFDTLDAFITLMLVGRWLQERWIARNRSFLLSDAGADGIQTRRIDGDTIEIVRAPQVRAGDLLSIAPGELVPVNAVNEEEQARFSLDWVNGESDPRDASWGEALPAGAFNAGEAPIKARATTDFSESPLPDLLRATRSAADGHATIVSWATRWYVPAVLALSGGVFALWRVIDPSRALDVTVALLVVTCPCAIGIAVPLAYELAFARLRKVGVYVRAGDLLDRLRRMRFVLLDKTGTVTLSRMELVDPSVIRDLSPEARDVAYTLSASNKHPVGRCLFESIAPHSPRLMSDARIREIRGQGVELERSGETWRLGRGEFACPGTEDNRGTWLARNGMPVARFHFREKLRPGTRRSIRALTERGLTTWLVSGDEASRVADVAMALDIPEDRALARQTPEEKAAAVERLGATGVLFIGDGVNDALAFSKAACAGTPAVDQPVMPGKADFFLPGDSLDGLVSLFETSDTLRIAVRRNLTLALTYNALAVIASYVGWMTPLRAAIAMPVSSLTVLALTAWSMRERTPAASVARLPVPAEAT